MAEKQTPFLVQPSQSRKYQLRQSPSWDKCLCYGQDESGALNNFSEKKLAKISSMCQETE